MSTNLRTLVDESEARPMRDRDAIDGELKLIAALRRAALHHGGETPATARIDGLLDERLLIDESDAEVRTGH